MKAFTEMKVFMVAVNILETAETNNGDHIIIIASIDLDLEVDKLQNIIVHCICIQVMIIVTRMQLLCSWMFSWMTAINCARGGNFLIVT